MEKAVLDYFYLNPKIKRESDFAGLRINRDIFLAQTRETILYDFLDKFAKKTLTKRMNSFLKFIKNA